MRRLLLDDVARLIAQGERLLLGDDPLERLAVIVERPVDTLPSK